MEEGSSYRILEPDLDETVKSEALHIGNWGQRWGGGLGSDDLGEAGLDDRGGRSDGGTGRGLRQDGPGTKCEGQNGSHAGGTATMEDEAEEVEGDDDLCAPQRGNRELLVLYSSAASSLLAGIVLRAVVHLLPVVSQVCWAEGWGLGSAINREWTWCCRYCGRTCYSAACAKAGEENVTVGLDRPARCCELTEVWPKDSREDGGLVVA